MKVLNTSDTSTCTLTCISKSLCRFLLNLVWCWRVMRYHHERPYHSLAARSSRYGVFGVWTPHSSRPCLVVLALEPPVGRLAARGIPPALLVECPMALVVPGGLRRRRRRMMPGVCVGCIQIAPSVAPDESYSSYRAHGTLSGAGGSGGTSARFETTLSQLG